MKEEIFESVYTARWADIDVNGHMRHSAYNDYAAQLRVEVFTALGFPLQKLLGLGVGPVLFREEVRFLKEVYLNQQFKVTERLLAARKDGSKWSIKHQIIRKDELVAEVIVDGSWLDLKQRKVIAPPHEIIQMFDLIPKDKEFTFIPDKVLS